MISSGKARFFMSGRVIDIPLKIMSGQESTKAYGVSPKGMKVGINYNAQILRLIVVDAQHKNYMSQVFVPLTGGRLRLPFYYKKPINYKDYYLSSVQFVQSYPLWPAVSVARGYELLSEKERGIIKLFPAIRLELADKLCRSDVVTAGIFETLGQQKNITCDTLKILNNKQSLKNLQSITNQERSLLRSVLECASGMRQPKGCQQTSKKLSEFVLAGKTLYSVFERIKLK